MADKPGPLYKWITSYGAKTKVLTAEGRAAQAEATVQGSRLTAGKSPLRRMEAAMRTTFKGHSDTYSCAKSPIQFRKD